MKAILITIGVALIGCTTFLGAQDRLSTAKELYASAAYEEALIALTSIAEESPVPEVARQVDEYRAFCLYALGRTREAETVAETMIRREPLLRLDSADASPRLESMFTDVRKRMLPSIIRDRFRVARSAVDKKNFAAAEAPLTEARLMIVEAQKLDIKDEGLGDLSVLVDGFLQLIRSTSEQQAAARPAPAVAAAPQPVSPLPIPPPQLPPPPEPPAQQTAPIPQPAPSVANAGQRVYSLDDEDVTPPVAVDQRMPAMPAEMTMMVKALHTTGVLDIVIDEKGDVVDATIRRSVTLGFDAAVLRTARRWKYRPATRNGAPVRYLKTIALIP
jgi:TonB family protein